MFQQERGVRDPRGGEHHVETSELLDDHRGSVDLYVADRRVASSAAKRNAVARPMPSAAPVIAVTRPCNRIACFPAPRRGVRRPYATVAQRPGGSLFRPRRNSGATARSERPPLGPTSNTRRDPE